MKKLYILVVMMAMSPLVFAGGHPDHSSMGASKAGSGVHFYGRIYLGYDRVNQSGTDGGAVAGMRDNGQKSRLGIKFKENLGGLTLVGNAEYKFDLGDGDATGDDKTCSATLSDCRTFNLHVGNLGLMTPFGYVGAGTFESPYKTMGMYDTNMDTALALNEHGGTSKGAFGQAGTWESAISYHAKMGVFEIAYMRGMSDKANSNIGKGDYSVGITTKDLFLGGLELGFARIHDKVTTTATDGESNDKWFLSYKIMPGVGFFYTKEEMDIEGSNNYDNGNVGSTASSVLDGDGDINTAGLHVTMGNNMIQITHTVGDARVAGDMDYQTLTISNQMKLSKATDITFGVARQGFDGTGSGSGQNDKHKKSFAVGLTHSF
ncbi:MAG: porin [Pseudomonadota bacterium]|nr:porin [Pseudomonadota bacterium]